jgi:hypothetical chaperone protein
VSFTLGIDFGTTNTVVALAGAAGPAELVRFPAPEGELFAFRSCLSFHAGDRPNDRVIAAGPWAIEAYVEDPAARPRWWAAATVSRTCSRPSC